MTDAPDGLVEALRAGNKKAGECEGGSFCSVSMHGWSSGRWHQAAHVRAYLRARMPKPVGKIEAAVGEFGAGRNAALAEVRKAFGIEGKEEVKK